MDLDAKTCERARRSRDARFDGRFFVGVRTTGIYCRPVCPAPAPLEKNVRYFESAAAAAEAGLRPCLRCRPEAAPGTPAWLGTSTTVARALRLIAEGALDGGDAEALASRLGVTSRHLRRLFAQHVGTTPQAVALTRRAHFAKRLIDETTWPLSKVAEASGFGSVRRFNAEIRRAWKRTPTELRKGARPRSVASTDDGESTTLRIALRPPIDWGALLSFLGARATPGVELVEDGAYRRTARFADGATGTLRVALAPTGDAVEVDLRNCDARQLMGALERVRRLFDLAAAPDAIASHLAGDRLLGALVVRRPGLRVPGAWDGFELAVRAILGQQVSVAAAATLAGRLAAAFGERALGVPGLDRLFPTPERLASAAIEPLGVTGARAEAIRRIARETAEGRLRLDGTHADPLDLVARLKELPGVGEWTAQYVAMRAFGEPDALPAGDLVLRRAAGAATERDLVNRSQAWRPWRAYAAMHLWQAVGDDARQAVRGDGQSRRKAADRR